MLCRGEEKMVPKINRNKEKSFNVNNFSSGVNLRDGILNCLDTQFTEAKNVWYKNGILKTRPGFKPIDFENFEDDIIFDVFASVKNYPNITYVQDGETYFLSVIVCRNRLNFRFYSDKKYIPVCEIEGHLDSNLAFNVFQHGPDIYCFCEGYYQNEETPYYIFKIYNQNGGWNYTRITDDDIYIPTVLINGISDNSGTATLEKLIARGAEYYEDYNILSNKYKMLFSTAEKHELPDKDGNVTSDYMSYGLIYSSANFVGQTVTAKITDYYGYTYIHKVTIKSNSGYQYEENPPNDGKVMAVNGSYVMFFKSGSDVLASVPRTEYVHNNLEITAPRKRNAEECREVLNCTLAEWYGGESDKVNSGAYLFFGGNIDQNKTTVLCRSGADNPLYFPVNSKTYIGGKNGSITALAKQSNYLIVFKENEIHSVEYKGSGQNASFSIKRLHSYIGCDCPNTVKLCRNRLVWLTSGGKVYTMYSSNKYNERLIFNVSQMVEKKLSSHSQSALKKAYAADFQGNYVLQVENIFYLMQYDSYGYVNASRYIKSEDVQLYIPWWIWETPKFITHSCKSDNQDHKNEFVMPNINDVFCYKEKLYFWEVPETFTDGQGTYRLPELFCFEGSDDTVPYLIAQPHMFGVYFSREKYTTQIESVVKTKFYNFKTPLNNKKIKSINLCLGNNNAVPIELNIIADNSNYSEIIILNQDELNSNSPKYYQNIKIINPVNYTSGVMLTLNSLGKINFSALNIIYKEL